MHYTLCLCLWVRDAQACYQERCSPQVVSAPSAGVPAARLRVAMAWAEGFPEFIPSTSRVSARRHLVDESPALTAVLQAQRNSIVAVRDCGPGIRCGVLPRQPSSASAAIAITAVMKSDLMAIPLAIADGNVSMALPLRIRCGCFGRGP